MMKVVRIICTVASVIILFCYLQKLGPCLTEITYSDSVLDNSAVVYIAYLHMRP